MKKKVVMSIIVTGVLISLLTWGKLSSISGHQKVSYTPSNKECFSAETSRPWRYCIHTPSNHKVNGNIAYLLHGRKLDENTWNDDTYYTALVQQYWTEHQLTPPTVVTVSFGPVWLLTKKGQKERSGLLDVFTEEVIPLIEGKVGKPNKRFVFGESMGGVNSLVLGLHSKLFNKVAALCPPIYLGSPFGTLSEIQDFIKRTGADPKIIYGIIQLSKEFFADEAEWKAASPIHLVELTQGSASPEFYLSCGLYDAYGNFEGNQHLSKRMETKGILSHWQPLYGGHCAVDISSLAEFLVH